VRRLRPLLVLIALVAFVASCATDASVDETAVSASSAAEAPADDSHDEHDEHPDAEAAPGRSAPGSTEATLDLLRSIDPAVLASAHDHGDHAEHATRDHPNGIDPARIVIPAIGVDADVIDLGLQDDGTMEVPEDFAQTGWFDRGPKPGRVGPAVIAGHVDDRTGPAVFFRLSDLEPGDEIEVHSDDGEVVVFAVRETQQHPKDEFPTEDVYSGTPGPELRLITCSGEFDQGERSYRDNTIVFAERIG
jgi:sortase (surface protein transpeptidase)